MKIFLNILSILSVREKTIFFLIIMVGMLVSLLEILSFGSIIPIMELIFNPSDKNFIYKFEFLKDLLKDFSNKDKILIFVVFFTSALLLTNILNLIFIWCSYYFCNNIAAIKSLELLSKYLNEPYIFHLKHSKNDLSSKILIKIQNISDRILYSFIIIFQKFALLSLYIFIILLIDFEISFYFIFFVISFFLIINKFSKIKISLYGKLFSETVTDRMKILENSFAGIKDIIIFDNSNYFKNIFFNKAKAAAKYQAFNKSISMSPKYFLEIIILICMAVVFYLFPNINETSIQNNVGIISFIIICSMRTLPGFQSIFMAFTDIKTFIESLNECIKDLQKTNLFKSKSKKYYLNKNNFKIKKNITLKNISAKIDNKDLLKNINLSFEKNKIICVIGKSGSGKSSLINIISGLIEPTKGAIYYDNKQVNGINLITNSSLVSQSTVLFEDTIYNNVSFGNKKIDIDEFNKVIKISGLIDFYKKIKSNPNHIVKDSGKNFSGGEIQRLGLARALTKNSSVILLDEFTSALDIENEKKIFQQIRKYKKNRLIIFTTHKLSLLKYADRVIGLKNSKIVLDIKNFNISSYKNKIKNLFN